MRAVVEECIEGYTAHTGALRRELSSMLKHGALRTSALAAAAAGAAATPSVAETRAVATHRDPVAATSEYVKLGSAETVCSLLTACSRQGWQCVLISHLAAQDDGWVTLGEVAEPRPTAEGSELFTRQETDDAVSTLARLIKCAYVRANSGRI